MAKDELANTIATDSDITTTKFDSKPEVASDEGRELQESSDRSPTPPNSDPSDSDLAGPDTRDEDHCQSCGDEGIGNDDSESTTIDFPKFLQSLEAIEGPVDDALDAIINEVTEIELLLQLADLYSHQSGRVGVIRRVLGHDPDQSSLDRLHKIASRKSCLESMLALAEADHVLSQHSAALMYSERQQQAEFERWLARAADSGHVLSMMGMVSLLSQRDPERSFAYARQAADSGLRSAQYIVGRCLIMGQGIRTDFSAGLDYVLKAADAGMPDAQVLAGGVLIQEHNGVAADPERALRYFKEASEQNNAEALYILGSLLMSGTNGLEADRQEGVRLIRRAAEADNPRAQLDLGKMYNAGEHLVEDYQEGFAWCLRAALHGLPMGAFIVGIMHLEGMGCERNILAGCHWIERAAMLNHGEARKMLATLLSDPKIDEGFADWKMMQELLKIMAPSLRVNLVALS